MKTYQQMKTLRGMPARRLDVYIVHDIERDFYDIVLLAFATWYAAECI